MNKEVISAYYLERYILGELPDEETKEIGRLAATDPDLRTALEEIEFSNREILALYPPPTVRAGLTTLLEDIPKKSFPLKRVLTFSSAAALLLILILVLPLLKEKSGIVPPDSEQDLMLIKGIPKVNLSVTQLLVYRKIQDRVEILSDGDRAKAGDLLQLAYVSTEESYGTILSIDGTGTITLHFPETKGKSTQLEMNKQCLLPNAIELDDAPGFERFIFLTSGSPIDVDSVLIELEDIIKDPEQIKQAGLDLSGNLKQHSILILKGVET
ncbi:MAG: hypothetical protein JXB23_01650 [Candidatus Aminicenantes bacterium]|nr:hypothetical protein [Candidatus Aminicenantes bacterium]